MDKTVSVIIPTYNRKQMLFECVDSILLQTYPNIEIIIVDDCSPDGTSEDFAAKYNSDKIIYIKNDKNMGVSYNRRRGYNQSHGEYIVFMDDDDYYTDNKFFEKAVNYLNTYDTLSFVGANAIVKYEYDGHTTDKQLNASGFIKNSKYLKEFQLKNNKPHSSFTSIFVKSKLIQADFDNMKMVNDSSIYMRALLSGDAYIMDDFIGVYRIHDKNITYSLSVDFLIENLDEKKYVHDKVIELNLFDNAQQWLKEHTILTSKYFIKGKGRTKQDVDILRQWCQNNLGSYANEACAQIKKIFAKRRIENAAKSVANFFRNKKI